jgi:hypothetical protein
LALDKGKFISLGREKALGMAAACMLAIRPLLLVSYQQQAAWALDRLNPKLKTLAAAGWMEECSSIG